MRARLRRFLSLAVLLAALFTVLPAGTASAATPQCYRALYILPDGAGPGLWLPSAGTTMASTNCWMARGNVSDGVWALQRALIDCTWIESEDIGTADRDFGPRTQAALRYWQGVLQIRADGVYGPQTRAALSFSVAAGAVPRHCAQMFSGTPLPWVTPPR